MSRRSFVKSLLYLIACALGCGPVFAQERFSLYVPTPPWDVERMVGFADLRDGDFVIDLGSGDGRIVLEAVRKHAGVRGRGVEISRKLVLDSQEQAKAEGIAGRAHFLHQNAFDADLSEATVIFLWVYPELMRLLRPKILREARPGTRVITRSWDLGTWTADDVLKKESNDVYKYVVPAHVAGNWSWELPLDGASPRYSAVLEQHFQRAEGVVREGKRRSILQNMKLVGDQLVFTLEIKVDGVGLVRHRFDGRVNGNAIEGTVNVRTDARPEGFELPWRAERTRRSRYFAPTGLDIDMD